jgi:hypothetical protein
MEYALDVLGRNQTMTIGTIRLAWDGTAAIPRGRCMLLVPRLDRVRREVAGSLIEAAMSFRNDLWGAA